VDDEAGIEFSGENFGDDAIEGDGDGFDGGVKDFEGEIGGGEGAGDGDFDAAQILGCERLGGDDHGAVALADAAAATHERVVFLQVGVGVEADGGDVVEGFFAGALVEGLDVAEGVGEAIAGDADLVGGQAVEHEGVVGVGTMGDGDIDRAGCFSLLGAHGG
jgi:hypothetical protein